MAIRSATARTGFTSASGFGKLVDGLTDAIVVLMFSFIANGGMLALLAGDTIVGGIVLSASWSDHPTRTTDVVSWCFSLGTSALLLALWKSIWNRRGWKMLLPLMVALAWTAVDTIIDLRIVTFWQYGAQVMATSGLIPPNPTFMWWLKTIAIGLLATCGPPGVVLIHKTRNHSIRIGGAETAPASLPEPSLASG